MKPETSQKLKSLLAAAFQLTPAEISESLSFGDLPQWDSMGHMEVMLALEEQFGVEITADTIAELTSFAEIGVYVEANGHA